MPNEVSYDVFLSHSHNDAHMVEQIGVRLEDEASLRVWLDKWILVPGERWQQEMAKGLNEATTCAVCIGENTPDGWFREEIERALNKQNTDKNFRVIPIILPNGDRNIVDHFLELRTWVEFSGDINNEPAFHMLVSGIRGIAPGRNVPEQNDNDALLSSVKDKLTRIRQLRNQQLVDDEIALEYQRRLLDQLVNGKGE